MPPSAKRASALAFPSRETPGTPRLEIWVTAASPVRSVAAEITLTVQHLPHEALAASPLRRLGLCDHARSDSKVMVTSSTVPSQRG